MEVEVKKEMEEKIEEITVVEVNISFFQNVLMHLLYPQRYEPNRFHELEI